MIFTFRAYNVWANNSPRWRIFYVDIMIVMARSLYHRINDKNIMINVTLQHYDVFFYGFETNITKILNLLMPLNVDIRVQYWNTFVFNRL